MRIIPRPQLQTAIDLITNPDGHDREDIDVRLFRLIDDRELRRQRVLIEQFVPEKLPPDPSGFYDAPFALRPQIHDRWAIVDPFIYVDNDYQAEAPPEEFVQLQGYDDADGNFVPTPSLSLLPRYCSEVRDACSFKSRLFGPLLFLQCGEVAGEWGSDYEAQLQTEGGHVVQSFRTDEAARAIVGAVLLAVASGWTHRLASFTISG